MAMARFIAVCICMLATWQQFAEARITDLTDDTFDAAISDGNLWMLEFYAPWCGHCKQLDPVLKKTAEEVGDLMHIGQIDATKSKLLQGRFKVRSYPTIKFTQGGETKDLGDYRGGRTMEALVKFAKRMNEPPIEVVGDAKNLKQLGKVHEIAFVMGTLGVKAKNMVNKGIMFDVATKMQDRYQFVFLDGEELVRATFNAVDDTGATTDEDAVRNLDKSRFFFGKLENGKVTEQVELPMEALNFEDMLQWANDHRFPAFTAFGPSNFADMGSNSGRMLFIGVVDAENVEKTKAFKKELKALSDPQTSELTDEERARFVFGWLDGAEFSSFVSQFLTTSTDEFPLAFVLDAVKQEYYVPSEEDPSITALARDVASGRSPVMRKGWRALPATVWRYFWHTYWPMSLAGIPISITGIYIIYTIIRTMFATFMMTEEEVMEGMMTEKDLTNLVHKNIGTPMGKEDEGDEKKKTK